MSGRWLKFLSSDAGTETLLVCLPPGGRGASGFLAWRGVVPASTQLAVVAPPGREERFHETAVTEVPAYVDAVITAIESVLDGRSLVLAGACVGGMLAYETARSALARGIAVRRLCAIAARPPGHYRTHLRSRSDAEVLELVRQWAGTPDEVFGDPDFTSVLLPAFAADLELGDGYDGCSAVTVPVPVVAVAGTRDPDAGPTVMAGWAGATSLGLTAHALTGGHFIHHEQARTTVDLLFAADRGGQG